MIIGHLPAAYIVSRTLQRYLSADLTLTWKLVAAGLLGGVFPDLDMFYYHLVDLRQHHHHSYWSHYPLVWLTLLAVAAFWRWRKRTSIGAAAAVLFALNGFVHLCLDTSLGRIRWLAPFVDRPFTLFELPSRYEPWWLNFILSWTFLIELFLLLAATWLFVRLEGEVLMRVKEAAARIRLRRKRIANDHP